MYYEKKYFQFSHPCNVMLDGVTGSGKTILVRKILKNFNQHFTNLDKKTLKVLWCYGQWHSLIDLKIDENIETIYNEGIPERKIIEQFKPDILVIDDLMKFMDKLEDFFTIVARHCNCSIFFLVQNMFYHAKSTKTVRNNCQYLIPMKFPQDRNRIKRISNQFNPSNPQFLIEAYINSTMKPYGYIRIDCSSNTPDNLRVQTNITIEENSGYFMPIVYLPKNVAKYK